jgi:hypothetical protein
MTPEEQEQIDRETMVMYGKEILSLWLEKRLRNDERKTVVEEILKMMENSVFITDGLKNEIKKKSGVE